MQVEAPSRQVIADRSSIGLDEFLRLYPARTPQLMWFLGAGASVAAGVPTAVDMIWDFKRSLYCSQQKVPITRCPDLSDQRLRDRLQLYFSEQPNYPQAGAPDEYSFYFERAYPDEQDRRRVMETAVRQATPSFGHLALAALMASGKVQMAWTTNFDRCVEDAWNRLTSKSGELYVGALNDPKPGTDAYAGQRWPIYLKLHGDFHSSRLKNTARELQQQDDRLREVLVDACRFRGLVIVGYSGRDDSIMAAFRESLNSRTPFPAGVFWFVRSDTTLSQNARAFLEEARKKGLQAMEVHVETFDELMTSLLGMFDNLPNAYTEVLDQYAPVISDAPVPAAGVGWPVLRFNALPILAHPTVARRLVCGIGGAKEVKNAIRDSGRTDVFARRRREGVIGFGSDRAFRDVFGKFGIDELDLYAIESRRLRYESPERGLLIEALATALGTARPLDVVRRRGEYLLPIQPSHEADPIFKRLREAIGRLTGTIAGLGLTWREAIHIRIEGLNDKVWLVFEPLVFVDGLIRENRTDCQAFINNRVATRYNREASGIIDGWAGVLTGGQENCSLSIGVTDGVDAAFDLGGITTFSRALK